MKQHRLVSLWATIEPEWKIGAVFPHYLTNLILLSALLFAPVRVAGILLFFPVYPSQQSDRSVWSPNSVGDWGRSTSCNFMTPPPTEQRSSTEMLQASICRMSASLWNILPGERQAWALPTLTSPTQGGCAVSVVLAGGSWRTKGD